MNTLNKNELDYLQKIFRSIPLMSDFERGRLYGIAEEMERQNSKRTSGTPADLSALSETASRRTGSDVRQTN